MRQRTGTAVEERTLPLWTVVEVFDAGRRRRLEYLTPTDVFVSCSCGWFLDGTVTPAWADTYTGATPMRSESGRAS